MIFQLRQQVHCSKLPAHTFGHLLGSDWIAKVTLRLLEAEIFWGDFSMLLLFELALQRYKNICNEMFISYSSFPLIDDSLTVDIINLYESLPPWGTTGWVSVPSTCRSTVGLNIIGTLPCVTCSNISSNLCQYRSSFPR